MWSKKLWQLIDCRKKMNHSLYFPTTQMDDRKSLIQLIVYGIDKEGLTAYSDDLFQEIKTRDEVYRELGAGSDTTEVRQPDGTIEKQVIEREIRYDEIKQYEIKEQWYFDRKYSRLNVRIVGICPIREYIDRDTGEKRKSRTFWVYFPEARSLFANWEVFNRHNDAQRVSFDDFFHQRRFESYVTKESNVYGNREIKEYTTGINTLLEAEKIRNEIFQFEHDLWEY
jgi:gliding motility associated protien GldN